MRKAMWGTGALMVVVLALLGAHRYVLAQGDSTGKNPSAGAPVVGAEAPAVLATNEAIQRTYVFHGSGPAFPAGTFTAVDALHTIQCPGTTGKCTITADMSVQSGGGSTAGNNFAGCLYVDGVPVSNSDPSNGCHYAVQTPSDGSYVEGNELNQLSGVSLGSHTVQTFGYSNNGATGGFFNIRYQVLKP